MFRFISLVLTLTVSAHFAKPALAADVTLAFRATAAGAPLAFDAPGTLVAVGQNRLSLNLAKHPPEGLSLTDADQAALVAFLRSLTDEGLPAPTRP